MRMKAALTAASALAAAGVASTIIAAPAGAQTARPHRPAFYVPSGHAYFFLNRTGQVANGGDVTLATQGNGNCHTFNPDVFNSTFMVNAGPIRYSIQWWSSGNCSGTGSSVAPGNDQEYQTTSPRPGSYKVYVS